MGREKKAPRLPAAVPAAAVPAVAAMRVVVGDLFAIHATLTVDNLAAMQCQCFNVMSIILS
jgi:hypothetical protein